MTLLEFQIAGFLGRFHPIVVHLPIGFLLLAGITEIIARRRGTNLDNAISLMLLSGAVASVLAVVLGWLLAGEGGYDESTLFWHRWVGVAVAVISIVAWLAKSGKLTLASTTYKASLWGMVILIAITGHLGGNLTHGPNYLLEYAPEPVAQLLGGTQKQNIVLADDPDSVRVYQHIIAPLLEAKCLECHNDTKLKGDLNLETPEQILAGGDNGDVIIAGNAHESEIFKRITLRPDSKKFMPPGGKTPLSYNEVKLIEWWLDSGADFETSVLDTGVDPEMKFVLAQLYGLDTDPKSYVERAFVEATEPENLNLLVEAGFYAQPIAANNNFIEVKKKRTTDIDKSSLNLMDNVKQQVTWLHVGGAGLTDQDLAFLEGMNNLTRLHLENNPITEQGLKVIEGLPHLESLNLYGTNVTGAILETLQSLPSLKKVYLWQSKVSQEEAAQIQEALPEVDVDVGVNLSS
jgi:uncharacterized membrane protein